MKVRRFGLCAAPLLFFVLDISLTLYSQPSEYWAGSYEFAREGSPEVRRVMQFHPALLFVMIAVWMGVIVMLVQFLPRLPAEVFSVSTTIAHMACGAYWLRSLFTWSYQLTITGSIVAGCLVVFSLRAGRSAPIEPELTPSRFVWCFIVFTLGVIAYAVLYPH